MNYQTAILPCGLRVIHLEATSPVVYCGYQIAVGARHELPGEEGLAHFCEHVTFKGTHRRSALQVINALERVGGELNAYTTKEDTTYYAAIHRDHFRTAVDLLTDIVFSSQYPQQEIDKEVAVICDEIESYNDSPSERIFDDFENIVFAGHPLGHNILGDADRLRSYTTADALSFTRRHYRPANAVFFVYGDVPFQRVIRLLSAALPDSDAATAAAGLQPQPAPTLPSMGTGGQTVTRQLGTHQAHVVTGCRAYAATHPRRTALYLLNNLLGGPGMNSRLNLTLRERHGLVYTVESAMTTYGDTGLWTVYYGCDQHDVSRCRRLVAQQLQHLADRPLTTAQMVAAKRQLKGQIAIACDNRENFALDFGKSFLHRGTEKDIDRLYDRIDRVSAADVQQVAAELFAPTNLTTLVYQ